MAQASKRTKLQRARKLDWAKRKHRDPADRKARNREASLRYRMRLRAAVFLHYGGPTPKCACPKCDETNYRFLTIDHIAGKGNIHRRSLKMWGLHFYRWLIKEGFPAGSQVLCWNCNSGRHIYGTCPHLLPRERLVPPPKRPTFYRWED